MGPEETSISAVDSAPPAPPTLVEAIPPAPAGARDEVSILRGAAAGDSKAVKALMDVHMPTVHGFVYGRLAGNLPAVEDVLQDTLLEAVRSTASFRGESSLATWLCSIARRRVARYYEAERRSEEAGKWLAPTVHDAEAEIDGHYEVVRALGQLAPAHRQALTLKYLDELTVEQIAQQMGKERVQVQSLLQRARTSFKAALHRDER